MRHQAGWKVGTVRGVACSHDLFVIGRISKGEKRLMFPHSAAKAPFPGPWEVRAVFAGGTRR